MLILVEEVLLVCIDQSRQRVVSHALVASIDLLPADTVEVVSAEYPILLPLVLLCVSDGLQLVREASVDIEVALRVGLLLPVFLQLGPPFFFLNFDGFGTISAVMEALTVTVTGTAHLSVTMEVIVLRQLQSLPHQVQLESLISVSPGTLLDDTTECLLHLVLDLLLERFLIEKGEVVMLVFLPTIVPLLTLAFTTALHLLKLIIIH